MRQANLIRRVLLVGCRLAVIALLLALASSRHGLGQSQQPPAPIERRAPSAPRSSDPSALKGRRLPQGEHLAEWMSQHGNLTAGQQQQALEHEPGFQELPRNTQQRYLDRLAQLDSMTPQQRDRILARTEAMEHLEPDQRAQVRGAMAQLGSLPQEDRRAVARTFRALREVPAEQRLAALDSGRMGPPLTVQQRTVLLNLLRVEPLMGAMLLPHGNRPQNGQVPSMGLR